MGLNHVHPPHVEAGLLLDAALLPGCGWLGLGVGGGRGGGRGAVAGPAVVTSRVAAASLGVGVILSTRGFNLAIVITAAA